MSSLLDFIATEPVLTPCLVFVALSQQYLPKHLHIVCVDMPGHEGTTRTGTEDYSIHGQVRRIHQVNWGCGRTSARIIALAVIRSSSPQFVKTVGMNRKPFHLVGTSMGGNVAGVYAACHPSEICSITLICPFGE